MPAVADSFTDSDSSDFQGSSWGNVSGKIRVILGARVSGMRAKRVKPAARMLPDATALVPMETQSPKHPCQCRLASRRNIQPNPFADDLGNCVLARQLASQKIQDCLGGQSPIGAMLNEVAGF